jgi:hypothetical protein
MYQIGVESIEVLAIFLCGLILFTSLSRIIFFDFDDMFETKENYAGFNYQNFSKAFYTNIVAISTTNYPMAMVKAYS